jgi:hypothetical protein
MKTVRRMTEPEPSDIGTIVLYIFFCLVVAAAIAGILPLAF